MVDKEKEQIIKAIQMTVESCFKNMIYYNPTYIKMENNETKVITDLYGVDHRMIIKAPRRYRKRLLKQGYIIYIGYLGRKEII